VKLLRSGVAERLSTSAAFGTELSAETPLELEAIYREHSANVSKWVRRLWGPGRVSGAVDAEDLLHEVFLVVQRRLESFRSEAALTTWLYGITVLVVSARRKKERWRKLLWHRAEPELQLQYGSSPSVERDFERAEASHAVYEALNRLSERDRTLLILFEIERLSGSQIAEVLQMSEANVWVGLTRARARFKKVFAARDTEASATVGVGHVVG
jgi:RNA polymerase sigma-70 factor (ECF subfamily)